MFRGRYTARKADGAPMWYERGDTVAYAGKFYDCSARTSRSPLEDLESWRFTGNCTDLQSATPPPDPVEGQGWVDDQGRRYEWVWDGDSYQWVQT